ncbi:MAG: hypothetical protein CVU56_23390 [Deltaproteobacteria bacterium HGW-Deltaproteobacteria-14]|nr:MAG: hypothetical protein CVU56_23390 [Deltaproteobacteria bacterium HGW-Deltaproteobacteria-14]
MELTRKTTILSSPALHDRLVQLARRRGVSTGQLIRQAVESQYGWVDAARLMPTRRGRWRCSSGSQRVLPPRTCGKVGA